MAAILQGVDEPLTRVEKRRVVVNLVIRFGVFGFFTWWLVAHADGLSTWAVAIYAFVTLALLLPPVSMVISWIFLSRRGEI